MRVRKREAAESSLLLTLLAVICVATLPAVAHGQLWSDPVDFGENRSMHEIIYPGVGNTIVGATNIFRYNNGGDLWQSRDGGETWNETEEEVAVIRDVDFVSPLRDIGHQAGDDGSVRRAVTGWAVGGREQIGIAMFIGRTTDAGATWTDYSDNFKESLDTRNVAMYGLAVIDADTAYVASREQVYRTNDGGASWQQCGDIHELMPVDDNGRVRPLFHDLRCHLQFRGEPNDPNRPYGYVTSPDSLFVTRNGGANWERIDPPWNVEGRNVRLLNVRFFDGDSGLILLSGEVAPGVRGTDLMRTNDGGRNWSTVTRWKWDDGIAPRTLFAFDGARIWLGGDREHIWSTSNGGADWELEHSSDRNRAVMGFSAPGPGAGLVAWTGRLSRGPDRISSYLKRDGRGLPDLAETEPTAVAEPERAEPATAPEPEVAEEPTEVVSDLVTALDYGEDRRPVDVRTTFRPTDNPIHVWMRITDPPAGETIRAVWYYLGLDEPFEIGQVDAELAEGVDHFHSSFELAEGNEWPEGEYRIDVFVGDEQVTKATFHVTAD